MKRNCLTEGAGSTPNSWFSLPLSLLPPSLKSLQTVVLMDVWALDADIHQLRQSDNAEFAPPVSLDPFRGGEAFLNTGRGEWEYKYNIKQLQNIARLLLSSLVRGKLFPKGLTASPLAASSLPPSAWATRSSLWLQDCSLVKLRFS